MEVGLMDIVRSVNKSWIYDTYFSLYRAFHPGGKVRGELSGYRLSHGRRLGPVFGWLKNHMTIQQNFSSKIFRMTFLEQHFFFLLQKFLTPFLVVSSFGTYFAWK